MTALATWDAQSLIEPVRHRIWQLISKTSSLAEAELITAGMLDIPASDVRRLGDIHFAVSAEARRFLASMPRIVRRLANTTNQVPEESSERIRGSIHWPRTIQLQTEAGHRGIYATFPVERSYATPENAVVWHTLDALVHAAQFTRSVFSEAADLGVAAADVARQASHWIRHPMLTELAVRRPSPRDIATVRRGRRSRDYEPALEAWLLHDRLSARLDRAALADIAASAAILNADSPTLFEIAIYFAAVDAIEESGFELDPPRIHFSSPTIGGSNGAASVEVMFQPRLQKSAATVYGRTLSRHGVGSSALTPDLALRICSDDVASWLIVEVKGGPKRSHPQNLRDATFDLLAYRTYFEELSDPKTFLGVGWGGDTKPIEQENFHLCSPQYVTDAVGAWLMSFNRQGTTSRHQQEKQR